MQDPQRSIRHKAEDDLAFHLAIAKAAGSSVYLHLMGVLGDILEEMLAFHRYTLSATPEDDRAFLNQHEAVFAAIAARDGEAAAHAMQEHLTHVLRRYERYEDSAQEGGTANASEAMSRASTG
jgi:DNA-binding FadR family transcriptional regulator